MKIVAINGSHRAGKCTSDLLKVALHAAEEIGAEVELMELSEFDIGYCTACNTCLRVAKCSMTDDMDQIVNKLKEADGIILGSPDYFSNVTARMKTFIERTRFLHMTENMLKGKVGGYVTVAGLNNCGGESAASVLDHFFATQEILVVHPRPQGAVLGSGANATTMAGIREDGRITWRRTSLEDEIAVAFAKQLGQDMTELISKLKASSW